MNKIKGKDELVQGIEKLKDICLEQSKALKIAIAALDLIAREENNNGNEFVNKIALKAVAEISDAVFGDS